MEGHFKYATRIVVLVTILWPPIAAANKGTPRLIHEDKYSWQQNKSEKLIWLHQDATNADL